MLIVIHFKSYKPSNYQIYLIKNTTLLILLWIKIFLRIYKNISVFDVNFLNEF